MTVDFFIPKMGQTVEEVTLMDWLVRDGDLVEQGQTLLEVETDKAVFPIEAPASGYIHFGPYREGDVVPVVTVVAVIGNLEDKFPSTVEKPAAIEPIRDETSVSETTARSSLALMDHLVDGRRLFASPRARKLANEKKVDLRLVQPTGYSGIRIREQDVVTYLRQVPKATPVAQRIAAKAGVHLESLSGSGPKGKIMRADVEHILQAVASPETAEAHPPKGSSLMFSEVEILEHVPLTGVRGIIAERMGISAHTTARVTLMMEVDATELTAMRERIMAKVVDEWGFTPSYNDLFAKIVAIALRKFPYMNARLTQSAIEYLANVNIGIAVDTERGLVVPVIHNVDQKSLRQFGEEYRDLVERAKNRKTLPEDLQGGTFTITNLGAYDVDAFTPIINIPEAAILGIGRIAEKVVPNNGQVVIRKLCTLSLVFDHRLVDGAPAARFLQYIKTLIEDPYLLVSTL